MIAAGSSPRGETYAVPRPGFAPIVIELAVIALPALALVTAVSVLLASDQRFLGFFGDPEQHLWIVNSLKEAIGRGDTIDSRTFFGTPTPLAYNLISPLTVVPTFIAYEITGNNYFAYNFVLMLYLLLNFCSMYAVLRMLQFRRALALAFATVFLLAPNTMVHAFGHLTLIVTFLIPPYLYCLYLIKSEPGRVAPWIALGVISGAYICAREELGLFVVLMSLVFLSFAMRPFWRRALRLHLPLYVAIVAVLASPVVLLYADRMSFDDSHGIESDRTLEEVQLYSSSPENFLFPSDEGPVYRHLPTLFEHTNKIEHLNYLGIVNLAGVGFLVYLVWFRRDLLKAFLESSPFIKTLKWELFFLALLSLVLSFGPILELGGLELKLPLHLGYEWGLPVVGQMRVWSRFGIFVFVAATLLTAHIVRFIVDRYSGRVSSRVAVGAVSLFGAMIMLGAFIDQYPTQGRSFPSHRTEVPAAVNEIKADPGNSFVMHLPLGVYTGAAHNATAQYFQLFHQHRLVNGYTSAYNKLAASRILSTPLICLNYPEVLNVPYPAALNPSAPDPKCTAPSLSQFLAGSNIGYIIYEKKGLVPVMDDEASRRKLGTVLDRLVVEDRLEVFYDDSRYTFYRVVPDSAASIGK
jgi:hypothetical protein